MTLCCSRLASEADAALLRLAGWLPSRVPSCTLIWYATFCWHAPPWQSPARFPGAARSTDTRRPTTRPHRGTFQRPGGYAASARPAPVLRSATGSAACSCGGPRYRPGCPAGAPRLRTFVFRPVSGGWRTLGWLSAQVRDLEKLPNTDEDPRGPNLSGGTVSDGVGGVLRRQSHLVCVSLNQVAAGATRTDHEYSCNQRDHFGPGISC